MHPFVFSFELLRKLLESEENSFVMSGEIHVEELLKKRAKTPCIFEDFEMLRDDLTKIVIILTIKNSDIHYSINLA